MRFINPKSVIRPQYIVLITLAEFLITNQKYTDALHILLASYKKLMVDDREMGYVAYSISDIYRQINDKDKEK